MVGVAWDAGFWEAWVSSLLCGVREIFSLKLKRGEVSAVVGDDGPALDTVLEGPLLSAARRGRGEEDEDESLVPMWLHKVTKTGKKNQMNQGSTKNLRHCNLSNLKCSHLMLPLPFKISKYYTINL